MRKILSILVMLLLAAAFVACSDDDAALPGIDLGALASSGAVDCQFYDAGNSYGFGSMGVSAIIRFGVDNNPITINEFPFSEAQVLENGNVNLEVVNTDGVTGGLATWGASVTETKYQGDPTTEVATYAAGVYTFTIDKTKLNFGVDKMVLWGGIRPSGWGQPVAGEGTGIAYCFPYAAATATGTGALDFDGTFASINLGSTNIDATVQWIGADQAGGAITNIGVQNSARSFTVVIKGSLTSADLLDEASASGLTGVTHKYFWCPFILTLGK